MAWGFIKRGLAAVATIVAVVTSLATAAPASAQAGMVGIPIATCIAPVRAGDTVATMLAATSRFDCTRSQRDFGSDDFWVRANALPDRTDATRLRVASVWQRRATLHAVYSDGAVYRATIDDRAATRRIRLGAIIEQVLPDRHGVRLQTLLWRIEGSGNLFGVVMAPRLATPRQSEHAGQTLALLYGAFVGMCIALLVYNLAVWTALRHRFQLVYCGMVAMLLVYAVSSSGWLALVFPDMPNTLRIRLNYLSLAGAGAAALMFARHFFEGRVFAGWLDRALPVMMALLPGAAILFAVAAPWHLALFNRLYTICFMALVAITVPILWRAWRVGSRYLLFFALAWAAPIVLAAFRVAGNLGVLRWSFLLDNSTLAAMSIEALASSLAIAYRLRMLMVERDRARDNEIAARLLADSDPLTGLANRRAFLREAIGRRDEQVLLLADIDHFKGVNDTIGHDGGDEVLRIVARALCASAPSGALVARLGGEEFAILARADAGLSTADVLGAVRTAQMPYDIAVTVSLGLARGGLETDAQWKAIYRRADRALFDAKDAGRDRARHADPALAA